MQEEQLKIGVIRDQKGRITKVTRPAGISDSAFGAALVTLFLGDLLKSIDAFNESSKRLSMALIFLTFVLACTTGWQIYLVLQ